MAAEATSAAAKRYAQAAFELASQANALPAWADAIDRMAAFMAEADVKLVLENSRVPQEAKQRLISAALPDLPGLVLNLARLLVRKDRTALAPAIAPAFRELLEQHEGIARARAVTAVPLTDGERTSLAQRLERDTGRRILLETEVDPDLLGGVRVQIGDQLVDASTRARLSALRRSLVRAM
jgi:F-type H+-transporting ATPase subunit delta